MKASRQDFRAQNVTAMRVASPSRRAIGLRSCWRLALCMSGLITAAVSPAAAAESDDATISCDRLSYVDEDFSHLDLSGSTLICKHEEFIQTRPNGGGFTRVTYEPMDFSGADFSHANLRDSTFGESVFVGARFDHADLTGAVFRGGDFRNASFRNALFDRPGPNAGNYLIWPRPAFNGADFSGATFNYRGWFFDFSATNINVSNVDLSDFDLSYSSLGGVDFRGSKLTHIRTMYTNFAQSDFRGANLVGADLRSTFDLDTAVFDSATIYSDDTVFPAGFDPDALGLTRVTIVPGDANFDGKVDAEDLNAVALHWGQGGDDQGWANGDFNSDGVVDAGDLNLLAINWWFGVAGLEGAPGVLTDEALGFAGASATVPEPATFALLAVGLIGVARGRPRRVG